MLLGTSNRRISVLSRWILFLDGLALRYHFPFASSDAVQTSSPGSRSVPVERSGTNSSRKPASPDLRLELPENGFAALQDGICKIWWGPQVSIHVKRIATPARVAAISRQQAEPTPGLPRATDQTLRVEIFVSSSN